MTTSLKAPTLPSAPVERPLRTPRSGFWEHFVQEHWGKKPAVFRNVLPELIATPEEMFEGLRNSYACRGTDIRSVYVNGRRLTPAESFTFQPWPEEGLDAYLARITAEQEVTFIIYGMQLHFPDLWLRTREFLSGLLPLIGVPLQVDLELFSGRYRATPRGPHRDDASNLSWILKGEKTMLVWPPDFFEERGLPTATQHGQSWPRDLCEPDVVERFRDEAIVLHGEPGDLLYWPYSYWHMAVADTHDAPVMLNTCLYNRPRADALVAVLHGLLRQMDPARIDTFGRFDPAVGGRSRAPDDIVAMLANLGAVCASDQMRELLAERFVGHASASGFSDLPPKAPKALPGEVGTIRIDTRFPIYWRQSGEELRVWSNGYAIMLPYSSLQVNLLSQLNEGVSVPVNLTQDAGLRPLLEELQATRVLTWSSPA